jgi:thiamine-monophosphate kinase
MSKKEKTPYSIAELGEFGLIEHLTKDITIKHESTLKGIGDDAAVVETGDKTWVVTTDLLLEGIHFNLIYTPLKHLGYKAVVVNLSDVYAMNACPKQIIVSIGISSRFSLESMESLYEGIKLACDRYSVDLVGGDTSSSVTGLTISITALGEVDRNRLTYRHGARISDLICVTGDLGAAYLGLQLLEREKRLFEEDPAIKPDLTGYEYVLERQLKPEARRGVIEWFRKKNLIPTSMIDISDGLSSDMLHICKRSAAGCRIYQDKIPVESSTAALANEFMIDPMIAVMNGGEDYELLFTFPLDHHDTLTGNPDIRIIGHITDAKEGTYLVARDGNVVELTAQGWNSIRHE